MAQQTKTREQLAQMFISSLNEGQLPWTAGWQKSTPQNAVTSRSYSGINALYLSIVAYQNGYTDPRWCTFNQAKAKGWHIIKGSQGVPVEYWAYQDRQTRKTLPWPEAIEMLKEHPEYQDTRLILRSYSHTVFNAAQIDGIPERALQQTDIGEIRAKRDTLIANMGVGYKEEGSSAYYSPADDSVTLPPEASFYDTYSYMATLLHECGHATGHESRLNRDLTGSFGSESYAKEELRAEIASTFAAQAIGLQVSEAAMEAHLNSHKAYIQSWVKAIQDAPNELFAAIKDASKISDYLLEKGEFEVERSTEKPESEQKVSTPVVEVPQSEVVARYQSVMNMDPGYVNQIAIIRESNGYHNHFLYDEDKGKGAAGTGAWATLQEAVHDVFAHYPDCVGLYRYYSTQRPLGPGCFPRMDGYETVTNFQEGKISCEEIGGREAWGYVEYSAPLSPAQIASYELVATLDRAKPVIIVGRDENGQVSAFVPASPQPEQVSPDPSPASIPIYYGTFAAARANGESELAQCRQSYRLCSECASSVEVVIRDNFDGMHLNPDCIKPVMEKYGAERVSVVLAGTIQVMDYDGRFSISNKLWAQSITVPASLQEKNIRVLSHPAVLNGFVDQFRDTMREQTFPAHETTELEHEEMEMER